MRIYSVFGIYRARLRKVEGVSHTAELTSADYLILRTYSIASGSMGSAVLEISILPCALLDQARYIPRTPHICTSNVILAIDRFCSEGSRRKPSQSNCPGHQALNPCEAVLRLSCAAEVDSTHGEFLKKLKCGWWSPPSPLLPYFTIYCSDLSSFSASVRLLRDLLGSGVLTDKFLELVIKVSNLDIVYQ